MLFCMAQIVYYHTVRIYPYYTVILYRCDYHAAVCTGKALTAIINQFHGTDKSG